MPTTFSQRKRCFFFLFCPNIISKSNSVYGDIERERKAANPHMWEAGTSLVYSILTQWFIDNTSWQLIYCQLTRPWLMAWSLGQFSLIQSISKLSTLRPWSNPTHLLFPQWWKLRLQLLKFNQSLYLSPTGNWLCSSSVTQKTYTLTHASVG